MKREASGFGNEIRFTRGTIYAYWASLFGGSGGSGGGIISGSGGALSRVSDREVVGRGSICVELAGVIGATSASGETGVAGLLTIFL